jgi:hypothetical protein
MRSELVSPGRALCILTGWPNVPPRDIRALSLSVATLLRLCGREGVNAEGEPTADGARFEITWSVWHRSSRSRVRLDSRTMSPNGMRTGDVIDGAPTVTSLSATHSQPDGLVVRDDAVEGDRMQALAISWPGRSREGHCACARCDSESLVAFSLAGISA